MKENNETATIILFVVLACVSLCCLFNPGGVGENIHKFFVVNFGLSRFGLVALIILGVWQSLREKSRWVHFSVTYVFVFAIMAWFAPEYFGKWPLIISVYLNHFLGIWFMCIITLCLVLVPLWQAGYLPEFINAKGLPAIRGAAGGFGDKVSGALSGAQVPALFSGGGNRRVKAHFNLLLQDRRFMMDKDLVPIGVTPEDRPHYETLGDNTPHLLAAGKTGSGKTAFLQSIAAGLAVKHTPDELQLVLIDGKRKGFRELANLPHVIHDGVLSEEMDVVNMLMVMAKELKARINEDKDRRTPKLVGIIDDIDDYFGDKKLKPLIEKPVTYIVKKGRDFGIHLIIGSQRPSGDLVSAHILSQMGRVCLKVQLPKYSENIIEIPDGAKLRGQGDLLYLVDGEPVRAQGFYLPKEQIPGFVRQFERAPKRIQDDSIIEGDYREVDDGIDLFVPDRNRVKERDAVCMYDNILSFEDAKNGVWNRMDGHTAIHTNTYNTKREENMDNMQYNTTVHTASHTEHTAASVDVSDNDIIEMINGGAKYRPTAEYFNVSLWRVQETMRKYKERQDDTASL